MCIVSFIGDDWKQSFPKRWPNIPTDNPKYLPPINREEFDQLKKEVEELKKLMKAAKEYDKNTGQPNCEMEDKIAFIKKIAELVGVNFDDVFNK